LKGDKLYWKAGLTVFLTAAAILLFYNTLFGDSAMMKALRVLMGALKPIVYGAMIAYLLAPMIDFWERLLFQPRVDRAHAEGKMCDSGVRGVSLILTWAVVCAAIWVFLSFLLPELYRSVVQLIGNVENYYNIVSGWIQKLLDLYPEVEQWVIDQMNTYFADMEKLLTTEVLPRAQFIMLTVSGGVFQLVGFLGDLVVGIIVSIYLMATKERCAAHGRKMTYGFLPRQAAAWVFRGLRKADDIFSGFVRGKLLDSIIIGILCFIGCQLLEIPYTPLVSVIVGVTNIIPFFGPFLGAIPSLFLILLANPMKAVYFLVFVICLQQLDGNVIGPKILGDRTGLSSLWVIIAILVGGSFFGVAGMFFGVPVCACLYSLVSFLVELRLRKKGLPEDSASYRSELPPDTFT